MKNGESKKIIICDDNKIFLNSMKIILTEEGYDVYAISDSEEGLEKIQSVKPDLVLMDLVMPKMTGDEVIKIIKNDKKTRSIPVILISASSEVEDVAKDANADDFLSKPFSFDLLDEKILKFLN